MDAKRRNPGDGGGRATHKPPLNEAAIREEVRKAFMSIRGMHIEDVFPPSGGHEVRP